MPRRAPTASSSSMKMIAGCALARLAEQAPDARGAEAGEHLDERRRRLREELRARLVGDGLGQQRLAGARAARGAGRPWAPWRPRRSNCLGVAQELDDLAQLGLRLVDAGDVLPADLEVGLGLDLDRLGLRHQLQRPPQDDDQRDHEEDREDGLPVVGEVADAVEHARSRRDRRSARRAGAGSPAMTSRTCWRA